MPRTVNPDAVEETMAELVLDAVVDPGPRILVAGEADDALPDGLAARGARVERWHRVAAPGRPVSGWPPEAEVDQAVLRMPRVRASLDLALHGVAARLVAGGELWVVGTNDEGIRSAGRRLEPLFDDVVTVDARRHGRVLRGRRRAAPDVRARLSDWRAEGTIRLPGGERPWVTYPGLFARGELDPATALLLDALPSLPADVRVLDFGCGAGTIGAALAMRGDRVELDQLDADALAALAARENLPGARTWLGAGLGDLAGAGPWDFVITNPPIHESVLRSYRVLERLLADVGARLAPAGEVWLVVQRQVPLAEMLARSGLRATEAAQRGAFRVWRAAR